MNCRRFFCMRRREERGAAAVALFGGVEVLLKLVAVAIEGSQDWRDWQGPGLAGLGGS